MLYDVCDDRCERNLENHFCENSEERPQIERGRTQNKISLSIISEHQKL